MHPVLERLSRLRDRECLVAVLAGVSTGVAALLALALIAWLLDWSFDLPAGLWRGGLTVLSVGGGVLLGGITFQWYRRRARSQTAWALVVEEQHPASRGWISAAVDFLASPESHENAPGLAELAIARGHAHLDAIPRRDLHKLVDRRPAWLGLSALAGTILLICIPFAMAPANAAVAMQRWAFPWVERAWVRQTSLRWLDENLAPRAEDDLSDYVASGEPLTLLLDDERGRLPADLRIQHELPDGQILDLTLRQTILQAGDASRPVAVATILPTAGRHRFRASGGDDDRLPPLTLTAETAPVVNQFQIVVRSPAYSRRPVDESQSSVAHFRALVGSIVTITGTASTPLSSCRFITEQGDAREVPLSGDGLAFTAEVPVTRSGRTQFWFDLEDRSGLSHPRPPRYEGLGEADAVPVTTLELPEADIRITPRGVLTYRMTARDDLGIAGAFLQLRPPGTDRELGAIHRLDLAVPDDSTTAVTRDGSWSLADLALEVGQRFELEAVAFDAHPGETPGDREGHSSSRNVLIVSEDEKQRLLASEEEALSQELSAVKEAVHRDFGTLRELRAGWRSAREMPADQLEALKRLADAAESVSRRLGTSRGGWTARLSGILDEREANGLSEERSKERLNRIKSLAQQVSEEIQPHVSKDLRAATRSLTAAGDRAASDSRRIVPDPEQASQIDDALAQAEGNLRRSTETLEAAAAELASGNVRRDLRQALDSIIAGQSELQSTTATTGRDLLAKPASELTPADRGFVATLAEKQRQLREQFSLLTHERNAAGQEKTAADPLSAWGKATTVSELMLQASQALDALSLGGAMETQKQLQELLTDLQREVRAAGGGTDNPLRSIEHAEQLIRSLESSQEAWRQTVEELPADPSADSAVRETIQQLQAEQQRAAAAADDLVQRLRRLAPRAAGPAGEAAQAIRRSGELLEDSTPPMALRSAQVAAKKLEETANALANAKQAAAQREFLAAYEQTRSLAQALAERQSGLHRETLRLEEIAKAEGRLSRSQLRTLNQLAADQAGLASDVAQLDVQAPDGVARWVASTTGTLMQTAAEQLRERQTGIDVQDLQKRAEQRLLMIASSSTLASPDDSGQTPPSEQPAQEDKDSEADTLTSLAPQLRLLRELQHDLIARTRSVAERPGEESLSVERARLAEEQQHLAEMAAELLTGTLEPSPADSGRTTPDLDRLDQELSP